MCGEIIAYETRKSRKERRCIACRDPIPKGFDYVTVVERDDRMMRTNWHPECRHEFDDMLRRQCDDCAPADWTWETGLMPQEMRDRYGFKPEDGDE